MIFAGPISWPELELLWERGELPMAIEGSLSLGQAAGIVLNLPPVRGHAQGLPVGFGLMPPEDNPPHVRFNTTLYDQHQDPILPGVGVVGALWREEGPAQRVTLRLWFPPGHRAEHRRAECFDNAITSVVVERGQPDPRTGWQLLRLDGAHPGDAP